MVGRTYVFILLGMLITMGQCHAVTNFMVKLTKTQIEYGKSTSLILMSHHSTPSLRTINLSALNHNFYVSAETEINLDKQGQQWRIHLYPRQTGEITIPVLNYGENTSSAIQLTVVPAIDLKTGNTLTIDTTMSAQTAWVNQQTLITVSIQTKNKHIVLENTSPILVTGWLQPLSTYSETRLTDGQNQALEITRHSTGWIYFPTLPGTHSLDLPPIQYKSDGVITHKFYLPVQQPAVKALPLYVPANFPVGELSLHAEPSSNFYLTGRLQNIDFTLNGSGIAKHLLPRIENYLRSQADLQLYPATTRMLQTADLDGLKSQAKLQIPFKASGTGLYQLDDIHLQYFEPKSGKIRTLHYQWPTLVFISPWLLTLISIFFMVVLAYILRWLFKYLIKKFRQQKIKRQARYELLKARTPEELKNAIVLMSVATDGARNTTLQCWHKNASIDIDPLNQALYRRATYDIKKLKQPYLHLC